MDAHHPDQGGQYYRDFGMGRSRATLPIQLAGNIKRPGLIEKAFGITLRELLYPIFTLPAVFFADFWWAPYCKSLKK